MLSARCYVDASEVGTDGELNWRGPCDGELWYSRERFLGMWTSVTRRRKSSCGVGQQLS